MGKPHFIKHKCKLISTDAGVSNLLALYHIFCAMYHHFGEVFVLHWRERETYRNRETEKKDNDIIYTGLLLNFLSLMPRYRLFTSDLHYAKLSVTPFLS